MLRGGFSFLIQGVKNQIGKNWCQVYLTESRLSKLLKEYDADLAEICRQAGCCYCPGVLHRADYERKPRDAFKSKEERPEEVYRNSFCCDQDGCRKRHTPPSIRFLGRRVYWGFVMVLVSAMRHGFTPERMRVLRQSLRMDRRTLERWRQWWLEAFVQSPFWKEGRARFAPLLCEKTLPLPLCKAFGVRPRDRLLNLLKWLCPLSVSTPQIQPM